MKIKDTKTVKATVEMKSPFIFCFKVLFDVSITENLLFKKCRSLCHLCSFDCTSGVSGSMSDKRLFSTSSIDSLLGEGNCKVLPICVKYNLK